MHELYPELEPFATNVLKLDYGHSIYFEQSGNKEGLPVIFLHGGPGSGCNENHRRYFDPDKYRIIIFDQRGCNRSTPNGCIEHNKTQDLLDDMERIRNRLGIEQWLIYAGSWGSTLGLLYAETYPERVSGMILRGSFLARQQDLDWFAKVGANQIFPDYWQEFIDHFNETERKDLIKSLHAKIFSEEINQHEQAAMAWATWAGRVVTSSLDVEYEVEDEIDKIINETRIEIHYALNCYFISENQILKNVSCIPDVPIKLIHGRRDLTCLPESSWLLHKALPQSGLRFIPDAGHLASEPAMVDALITATDEMVEILS